MSLPLKLERKISHEVIRLEEEKKMRYVTSFERIGIEKGKCERLIKGLEVVLQLKFASSRLQLMPEIRKIDHPAVLDKIYELLLTISSPEELRKIHAAHE